MEIKSVYRGAKMSAFKVRELTREIQGLTASAALDLIAFSPKKASLFVGKTLKSAIANAENNAELKVETLVVKEAIVGEGPTMKRIKSRARGSASPIRKRTSHITITLSDEIEIVTRQSVAKAKKAKAAGAKAVAPRSKKKPQEPSDATRVQAEPASQADEGPGETHAAPDLSSTQDATQA